MRQQIKCQFYTRLPLRRHRQSLPLNCNFRRQRRHQQQQDS
jgi:hypothetical protein